MHELTALNNAIYSKLTATVESWGNRVYFEHVPAGVAYPYVLIMHQGGGDQNLIHVRDLLVMEAIKCVSDSQTEALSGAKRLAELLDDQGFFDTATPLDGGADWLIKTSTIGIQFFVTEAIDQARRVYHAGNNYEFAMEEI